MTIGVGILGGGTVGGRLAQKLLEDRATITAKTGLELELIKVAVRDLSRTRLFPNQFATDDPWSVVKDPQVNLVVELLGGLDPSFPLVMSALELSKPVVTANKALVAQHGPALFAQAGQQQVPLLLEAAVGGGIPLIRPLSESLAGERIGQVLGIVNGTTNYILSAMDSTGTSYQDALADAQRLGFAEADPTADVSGADAAAKATILAGLAFGSWVPVEQVYTEGIENIKTAEISYANQLGYIIKLLAVAEDTEAGVAVRVHPAFIPLSHPLASVRGANNAVFVQGPDLGQLLFMGPGAGGGPTATAVLGDVIDAARQLTAENRIDPRIRFRPETVLDFAQVETEWYVRLEVVDASGVLAQIAGVFGEQRVSIKSVWQEGRGETATLLLITHSGPEQNHRAAVADLRTLPVVKQVAATMRVVGDDQN